MKDRKFEKGKTTHLRIYVVGGNQRGGWELFPKKGENLTGAGAQEEERREKWRGLLFYVGRARNNEEYLESFHRLWNHRWSCMKLLLGCILFVNNVIFILYPGLACRTQLMLVKLHKL